MTAAPTLTTDLSEQHRINVTPINFLFSVKEQNRREAAIKSAINALKIFYNLLVKGCRYSESGSG